jgi:hypothetical protein
MREIFNFFNLEKEKKEEKQNIEVSKILIFETSKHRRVLNLIQKKLRRTKLEFVRL